MQKFTTHRGIACPLEYDNIDTDQIIPKQFLLSVSKTGFGKHLFHDWRYLDDEERVLNENFSLNQADYRGTSILIAGENFGSGSSREHAPWALVDYGIRAIIAPSFADIFKNNALGNGLLVLTLPKEALAFLTESLKKSEDKHIAISLATNKVEAFGREFDFRIDEFYRSCLLEGLDAIGLTLRHSDKIKAYERGSKTHLVRSV
ncbi:3-isopropylmalate dehydratase small subunit [Campylobacter sp.]|uniref:3-isopropylmalate dehydratase small subunit n=1 Tax=Campylobacter sp. TaxID=205 RepID=UPI0026DC6CA7|nr:3-isopropylmalate dehydratase small subunit [Campylobacter sp.]MDO4674697.1 3-isopropylmalate dehydratase small subunit [Campylobacter sp.]